MTDEKTLKTPRKPRTVSWRKPARKRLLPWQIDVTEAVERKYEVFDNPEATSTTPTRPIRAWTDEEKRRICATMRRLRDEREGNEQLQIVNMEDGTQRVVRITEGGNARVGDAKDGAILGGGKTAASITAEPFIEAWAEKHELTYNDAKKILYSIGAMAQEWILQGKLFGIPHVGVLYLKASVDMHRQYMCLRTSPLMQSYMDLNGHGVYCYEDALHDVKVQNTRKRYNTEPGVDVQPYVPKAQRYSRNKYVIECIETPNGPVRRVRFLVEECERLSTKPTCRRPAGSDQDGSIWEEIHPEGAKPR